MKELVVLCIDTDRHLSIHGISQEEHSKPEIENRRFKYLYDRLLLEKTMADRKKFGKKALDPQLVT